MWQYVHDRPTCNDIQPDLIPAAMEDNGRTQSPGRVDGSPGELGPCVTEMKLSKTPVQRTLRE